MKRIAQILSFSFVLLLVFIPLISGADLIKCGGPTDNNPCDFDDFIRTIDFIIKWIISMAMVIFTISMIWGGFLWTTSGAKPANKEKAINILTNTLKGFVIILIAWLIVYTILNTLIPDKSSFRETIFKFIGKGK